MDTNSDNRLSRVEFLAGLANTVNRVQAEQDVITNGGFIDQRDQNGPFYNGQNGQPVQPQRTRAAQSGYDRGVSEGRQAGRDDHANGQGWDPEGRTELQRADSGYYSQLGALNDYQAGYREGFRSGYPEGFGQR
jgi:hypothetical protein